MLELVHDYPDKRVRLDVWHVRRYRGEVSGARRAAAALGHGRAMRELPLLEADWPIVERACRSSAREAARDVDQQIAS